MIEETGIVISTDGLTARVAVRKRGSCEGCGAKGVCETSGEGMEIEAMNPLGAKTGQTVRVSINPGTYLKGSMLVYGIPLVALIAGAIAGKNIGDHFLPGTNSDLVAAITGFSALIISFLFVRIWARSSETKTENKPVIEEIIEG